MFYKFSVSAKTIKARETEKAKVNPKVFQSKYVWRRVDHIENDDDDDEVQIIEKKIDGNQNVVGDHHRAAALYCNPCKVQCRNQVPLLLRV